MWKSGKNLDFIGVCAVEKIVEFFRWFLTSKFVQKSFNIFPHLIHRLSSLS